MDYRKIIILGTRSLTDQPEATLAFGNDNCIVIPMIVLDKLEKESHQYTDEGKNAKKILDYIDSFSIQQLLSKEGVRQKNGSILRLENGFKLPKVDISLAGDLNAVDRKRLEIALGLKQTTRRPVIMVTTNSALRIKAKSLGIKAQAIKNNIFPELKNQYKGRIDCLISQRALNRFYDGESLNMNDIIKNSSYEWYPNMFLHMSSINNPSATALGRFDGEKIVHLIYDNEHPYKVSPLNVGQHFIMEALMANPKAAPFVAIKGDAGTGKTHLSLAVALEHVIKKGVYERFIVSTPTDNVEDLGYLPGGLDKKMSPRLGGIIDNLNQLLKNNRKDKKKDSSNPSYHHKFSPDPDSDDDKNGYLDMMTNNPAVALIRDGVVELQLLSYIRGRSIPNSIFIIDEAQNIHPKDVKKIVTRAGKGSKFIFLGDPTQIDNPELNERFNGLVYLTEKMKESDMTWIINMKNSESLRGDLARYAASVL